MASHRLTRYLLAAGLGLLVWASPSGVYAGGTRTFNLGTYDDFDDGEGKGTAIESSGKVSVGYLSARSDVGADAVFACVASGRGAVVGTSGDATLQRVRVGGPGKAPTVTELAKLPGAVVSAMLRLKNGDILAATLPGGQIHRVSPSGKVTAFARLDVEQIWALGVYRGRLVAATGPYGQVYSLTFAGKDPKVIFDAPEKSVLSMLRVGKRLVVGTSQKARIYEVTGDKDGALLKEFQGTEVRALARTETGLLVVVNRFKGRGVGSLDGMLRGMNVAAVSAAPATDDDVSDKPPSARGSLYHVDLGRKLDLSRAMEATWERWLSRDKQYFTDVVTTGDRASALVASSSGARIYRARGLRHVSTVADLQERTASALCPIRGGRVLATTADGAAVYHLNAAPAKRAKFVTEVLDAEQPATFGTVAVRGRGDLRLRARSGPTDEPDKRWTKWAPVTLTPKGDGRRGAVTLPRRRYVQLEFTLAEPTAELRDVTLFYAPQNLAPLLKRVAVRPPKFDLDDNEEPDAEATIDWDADARDDDDLVYDVRIRPAGGSEREWMHLNEDEPVTKTEYTLDLETIPDGTYEVAVSASDEPTNGTLRARTDELRSQPFVVDRTRPGLTGVVVQAKKVKGVATDAGSHVHDVSYSIDGKAFRSASPRDGLFDSGREPFELVLPSLTAGHHRLVIRVRDASGNLVTRAYRVSR
ncbi:MAG: hypothetical protein B7733_14390 [Myxococcales bacterium FL481]|nr:MAG: hypothetical protein B7733_14390 [Myxococcales bacterium FL481]